MRLAAAILVAMALPACAYDERTQPHWPETLAPVAQPAPRKSQVRGYIHRAPPPRVIIKKDVVVVKHDRAEESYHCKPPLKAVGDQALSEDTARTAAEKHWMANARWEFGERFMDFKNAKVDRVECSRSSVPPTNGVVGQVLPNEHRCEIIARPCRPGLEK